MPKKSADGTDSIKQKKQKVDEILVQNLIELQKVHTHLLEKFDKLSNQISVLLNLFESAARSFAEHPANKVSEKDKDFLDKIDKLLDQNKTIARGLTLMEDRLRQRIHGQQPPAGQTTPPQENGENYHSSDISRDFQRF